HGRLVGFLQAALPDLLARGAVDAPQPFVTYDENVGTAVDLYHFESLAHIHRLPEQPVARADLERILHALLDQQLLGLAQPGPGRKAAAGTIQPPGTPAAW